MWTAVVNHMFFSRGDKRYRAVLSDVHTDPICQSPPGLEGWCSELEVMGKTGRLRQCYSFKYVLFLPLALFVSKSSQSSKTLWHHVGRSYIYIEKAMEVN